MIVGWSWLQSLGSGSSFKTIQTDAGTSPVATGPNDTLTLTSSDGSITITGNAATDTVNFVVAGAGAAWSRTGNAGTTAGTNFIGTTDNVDFVVKTNSVEVGRFVSGGGLKVTKNALGPTTSALGIQVVNTTSATAGSQIQVSPAVRWTAMGWKTNSVAADQAVEFQMFVVPVTGAVSPTGSLFLQKAINGAAFSNTGWSVDANGLQTMQGFASTFTGSISTADSSFLPGTNTHLTFLNPSGTQSNIYWKFGSTYKAGHTVSSTGSIVDRATGSYAWQIGADLTGSLTTYMQLSTMGLTVGGGVAASGIVSAGNLTFTTPATLSTWKSFAVKGVRVTASTHTLDATETFIYGDASVAICSGTPVVTDCSSYGDETTCNVHNDAGCRWDAQDCGLYDGDPDACTTGHPGCNFTDADCHAFDNTDMSTCEDGHTGCGYNASSACSEFNSTDETTCETGHTGCTYTDADCHAFDSTDMSTCQDGHSGCSWDVIFMVCNGTYPEDGTCGGVWGECSGLYPEDGTCDGTWPNVCVGTASCGNIGTEAECGDEAGCSWMIASNYTMPTTNSANMTNTSRLYSVMNIGQTGQIFLNANSGQDFDNGLTQIVLNGQNSESLLHHHQVTDDCGQFMDEGSCTPVGCNWDPDLSECIGVFYIINRWYQHNKRDVTRRLYQTLTQATSASTTETDLHTYTVPSYTLNVVGDTIKLRSAGVFAASAFTKRVKAYFGATLIFDSGALGITAATDWVLNVEVMKSGSSTQKCNATFATSSGTLSSYAQYTGTSITDTAGIIFKITGTEGTTGGTDVKAEMSAIDLLAAAA